MVKRKAFTLIELLVVIAVIAMLLTIMTPALNRARDVARRVVCASNMGQVLLGLQMYADDNRGLVVPVRHERVGGIDDFRLSWDQTAAEYFTAHRGDSMRQYLACPADLKLRERPLDPIYDELVSGDVLPRSYMLNGALENRYVEGHVPPPPWFGDGTNIPARNVNIDMPSEVIWFVECHVGNADENYGPLRQGQPGWEGGIQGTNYWPTSWWAPTVGGFIRTYRGSGIAPHGDQHRRGGNWAYMDGHVAWFNHRSPPADGGTLNDAYKAYQDGPVYPFSWGHNRAMRAAAAAAGYTR